MTYPGASKHFDFPEGLALPTLGTLQPGVTGIVPARNFLRLDYCAELAVRSLLPCCDEVIYCDSDSDDGSVAAIEAVGDPKIRIINYTWPDPVGDMWMLPRWIAYARLHARYKSVVQLDADEVLHPRAYPHIRKNASDGKSAWFFRWNFWRSAHFLAPNGTVCSHLVVRQNPTEWESVCDGHYVKGEPNTVRLAVKANPDMMIYHLGFCRRNDAFFAKSKVVQRALVNTYDWKLAKAEEEGVPWDTYAPWPAGKKLVPFGEKDYPPGVVEYLNARGY